MSRNDEAKIQGSAILPYIRAVAPEVAVFHIPNGIYLGDDLSNEDKRLSAKKQIAKLKWLGLLPGVFDLCLLWRPAKIAFIEVKTAIGRLSSDQKDFAALLDDMLIPWSVARSIDDTREALDEFGIVTREAKEAA